eukprot:COSAG02_NODE_2701_length_8203_cov_7.719521_10_plen_72_part_00
MTVDHNPGGLAPLLPRAHAARGAGAPVRAPARENDDHVMNLNMMKQAGIAVATFHHSFDRAIRTRILVYIY